ncbi:MAG: hypothetical protein IH934_03000 [Nanoarchaeota archaeon]|nr:hypothetical protein [Nanoarchaeota archaeon]
MVDALEDLTQSVHFFYTDLNDFKLARELELHDQNSFKLKNQNMARYFNPSIEDGAYRGLSLGEIQKKVGRHKYSIQNHLKEVHMVEIYGSVYDIHHSKGCRNRNHKTGEELRVEIRAKKIDSAMEETQKQDEQRKIFYNTLRNIIYLRSIEESPATHKKVVWRFSQRTPISQKAKDGYKERRETIDKLVDVVFDISESNEHVSYNEVARRCRMNSPSRVIRWLNKLDLLHFCPTIGFERYRIDTKTRSKYLALYSSYLGPAETAYFTGTMDNESGIYFTWTQFGSRPWANRNNPDNGRLTRDYIIASKLLYKLDSHVTLEEAIIGMKMSIKNAQSIVNSRGAITRHITMALDIIEPSVIHTKPYLEPAGIK